ncbi:hypothetical protein [Streptomyces triticirhizae]|uniref:hypothetical protein n=1 Tax=Streptomyces triticirhizae TaxID=2483353 RepID=UPI001F22F3CC|nr:hypothetical protein [Streptomyces triticirhizae]
MTGGSRGLGECVVRLLLSRGARVAACARREESLGGPRGSVGVVASIYRSQGDSSSGPRLASSARSAAAREPAADRASRRAACARAA